MLNISEIETFAIAAETESFSEAARQLHFSQPAISQQIHSLERCLGVELFRRSGRGVALTEAGEILQPMARELLDLSRRILETMQSLEGKVAGHLVIGCTTTAGKYVLPLLASAFGLRHPEVQVTIEMCTCDSVVDPLLGREFPLAISSSVIVHRDVECQPFFTDHVTLVVPADHPFAARSSIRPEELLGQSFILREEYSSTRRLVQEGLSEHSISLDQLQVVMVVGSAEAIVTAVEHNLGIAFVSRLAARHGLELGRIVEIPVEGLSFERPLYMVRSSRCAKTLAQTYFWEFVQEHRETIVETLGM